MKNILYFLVFAIFILAPLDIVLNFSLWGFNLRIGVIFMVLFLLLGSYVMLRKFGKEGVVLPLWFILLAVVAGINTVFVFNSILVIRGIVYALLFWSFVFLVFVFINLSKELDFDVITKLYVFSFSFHALFGLIQQVGYYLFGVEMFMTQPGRMNGFTYEPSYFATYLSPSVPLLILYTLLLKSGEGSEKRWLYYVSTGIVITALVLSTSKISFLGIAGSFLLILVFFFILFILRRAEDLKSILWFNLVRTTVVSIGIFLFFYLLVSGLPITVISSLGLLPPSHSLEVEKTVSEKMKVVLETREETSFSPRVEEFKKTLKVAFENFFVGTSLGGVAPHKAVREGVVPRNNQDVKPFEGMSIYAEMLAGFGILGFVVMVLFALKLFYDSFRVSLGFLSRGVVFQGAIIFALVSGLMVELALLSFNQNILRFYLWNQVAVLGLVLEKCRSEVL